MRLMSTSIFIKQLNFPGRRSFSPSQTTWSPRMMTTMSASASTWQDRVNSILSQDRRVQNFPHYKPSEVHVSRMKELAKKAPELYDNPEITPREKWFQHSRYRQNSQMPPFHVHFRSELQAVIRYLYEGMTTDNGDVIQSNIRRATRLFEGSMRGLHGHVNIEEYACFPLYEQNYPHVKVAKFLAQEHEALHQAEEEARKALYDLLDKQEGDNLQKESVLSTLTVLLDFDDKLMAHLGEEEEIVVPMSLTDKPIFF
jgi:Hemerythrin HHE cation binding domain